MKKRVLNRILIQTAAFIFLSAVIFSCQENVEEVVDNPNHSGFIITKSIYGGSLPEVIVIAERLTTESTGSGGSADIFGQVVENQGLLAIGGETRTMANQKEALVVLVQPESLWG